MFELKTATRLHEVGIVSNRRSASYGEFVLKLFTHRPSHAGSGPGLKVIKILTFIKMILKFFI